MNEPKCPKCSGDLRFMPPERPPEIFSWIGGELAGWVVFASTAGALGFMLTDRHAIAVVPGVVAAIGVFALLEHHRSKPADGPGFLYCPKCQYYFKPERLKEGAGPI